MQSSFEYNSMERPCYGFEFCNATCQHDVEFLGAVYGVQTLTCCICMDSECRGCNVESFTAICTHCERVYCNSCCSVFYCEADGCDVHSCRACGMIDLEVFLFSDCKDEFSSSDDESLEIY